MTNLPKTIRALKACIAELEKPKEFIPLTPDWVYVKEDDIERMVERIAELEKRCDKEFKDGFWRGFEVRAMNPVDSCIQGHYDWQIHLREQAKALKEQGE